MEVLEHTTNAFNGIVINPESLPSAGETFSHRPLNVPGIWKKKVASLCGWRFP